MLTWFVPKKRILVSEGRRFGTPSPQACMDAGKEDLFAG
jgi:hypothetical protein